MPLLASAHADTLHANLNTVRDDFEIERFAVFDQFPYTHHVECGVCLRRRSRGGDGGSDGDGGAAVRSVKQKMDADA